MYRSGSVNTGRTRRRAAHLLTSRCVRNLRNRQNLPRIAAARLRRIRPRWLAAAVGVVATATVAALAVTGSGSGTTHTRALTSDDADRLAITRFLNYRAGGRAVTITVPTTGGGLTITGSIDYRTKVGYGVVRGTGRDTSSDGLIEWSATTVLVDPMADPPAQAPPSPPGPTWPGRPLQTSGSSLDAALAIALSLGSDRPDNAELLPQDGALWVEQVHLNGHQIDVMSGPNAGALSGTAGTVRYWIGQDGTMYRVQASVASESQPVVIDFDTHTFTPVPRLPGASAVPTP